MPGAEPQESGKPADQIPIRLGDSKILKSLLTCWDGKFYDPHLIENDFHFQFNLRSQTRRKIEIQGKQTVLASRGVAVETPCSLSSDQPGNSRDHNPCASFSSCRRVSILC